jgi:FixJ family two-component response regulator
MTDSGTRRAVVCVVDDDESVREAVPDLLGECPARNCNWN